MIPPDDLRKIVDDHLIAQLRPGLKAAIDRLLAKGRTKRQILTLVRAMAGGRGKPVTLQVEAYLGCDQEGNVP